jgi:hypothetical protein
MEVFLYLVLSPQLVEEQEQLNQWVVPVQQEEAVVEVTDTRAAATELLVPELQVRVIMEALAP